MYSSKYLLCVLCIVLLTGCAQTSQSDPVRLIRDEWGTPHIYADTLYGLYYGYGYAIAQDRLFQMEMAKRSTQGTVAEVLGPDYLNYDRKTRELFSPDSIRSQLAALSDRDRDRDVFMGYAAGINAWRAEIEKQPADRLPKQYIDLDFNPSPWGAYDVAMIFIGTMNNRFGDFNTELENAAIYQALVDQHGKTDAARLFDLLNPRFTKGAPTSIPESDWSKPAYDSLAMGSQGVKDSFETLAFETLALNHGPVTTGFSNCYLLGQDKIKGGGSILINGPQFGWFNPSYVYSIGLHGAGIDVVGNSPFGYPMIMFGHNQTISWGSTWGASDIVDVFAESLNADRQYEYKGMQLDLEHRVETIRVRGSDDVQHDVYRSVHGPIVHFDEAANIAYARHRSWDGGELDTLLAWLYATWAQDFEGWKTEAEKSAINVNMYFADVDGNIGYFHGGVFPKRVAGHDNRLPVSGDGASDWQGRQDVDTANPHILNPSTGYLANWNNKPGEGVMNPDVHFFSWSRADRNDYLSNALASKERFTPEEAWSILEGSSYGDHQAPYFVPYIDSAVKGSTDDRLRQANEILQAWDQHSRDTDGDGFYDDPATAIFQAFIAKLVASALMDDLGEVYPYFSATMADNLPIGIKSLVRALDGESEFDIFNGEDPNQVIVNALSAALTEITEQHDSIADVRAVVVANPYSIRNFMGIPQAGQDETLQWPIHQNRGTENDMIIMKPGNIIGWEVTPPGQSGFIHPDGTKSPHYDDQLRLYHEFDRKRMWFYPADVEANKATEVILNY